MPLGTSGTVFTGSHLVSLRLLLLQNCLVADRSHRESGAAHLDRNQSSMCLPPGFKCLWVLRERSLQVPIWLACACCCSKTVWLLTGPIGNRVQPTWTAIKVQCVYHQASSAFGYFGNGHLQVPTWLACCYSKTFWLLTSPIGNWVRPTWTAIEVQSVYHQASNAFGKFGKRSLRVPTWLAATQKLLVAERSIGNQSGPPGPLSKVQNTCQEAPSAFGKFGKRPAQNPCKRTMKHGGINTRWFAQSSLVLREDQMHIKIY